MIGALCVFNARAHVEESRWLDDYHKPVGLTYCASAKVNAAYLWRGLYVGAMNMQAEASVGYGGLYANMWWNIGTADWTFTTFQPEVDLSIGFARWGLDVSAVFIHSFNCRFFDFSNHPYPDSGNALELGLRYTVSSKLPLSILWATRVGASDGYINVYGDTVRAYSTYIELSYTHRFPYDISLKGAVGMTPWHSTYTHFHKGFALHNIDIRLRKDWTLSERCGLMVEGQVMINPWALAQDRSSAEWHPKNPGAQSVNANITVGVYLK